MTRRLVGLVIGVLATLLLAEALTRWIHPRPPRQVLYEGMEGLEVWLDDGVPVWRVDDGPDRPGPARCASPADHELAFAGDSIFAAVTDGVLDSWTFGQRLAERLHRTHPDLCVRDLSVSGYGPAQILARLRRAHAEVGLDAAVVGVYKATGRWIQAGPYHIKTTPMRHTPAGLPDMGVPIPEGLHRALLGHSMLWRQASLLWATRDHDHPRDLARDMAGYQEIRDWAAEEGVDLLWTLWPSLDRPFADSLPGRSERAPWIHAMAARWTSEGERVLYVAELLRDLPLDGLAGDVCCHYTQRGHDVLAERLAPHVDALRTGAPPPPVRGEPDGG